MDRFMNLTRRLLAISREEVRKAEEEFKENIENDKPRSEKLAVDIDFWKPIVFYEAIHP